MLSHLQSLCSYVITFTITKNLKGSIATFWTHVSVSVYVAIP